MPTETVPPFVMRFDAGGVPVVAAIKQWLEITERLARQTFELLDLMPEAVSPLLL